MGKIDPILCETFLHRRIYRSLLHRLAKERVVRAVAPRESAPKQPVGGESSSRAECSRPHNLGPAGDHVASLSREVYTRLPVPWRTVQDFSYEKSPGFNGATTRKVVETSGISEAYQRTFELQWSHDQKSRGDGQVL
ncbi:MAG: hypothetical protein ACOC7P_03915 [Chloroflexota bacterium]